MITAAVAHPVRGAALDLAPRQITINNVQPDPVEADMTADLMAYIVLQLLLGRIGCLRSMNATAPLGALASKVRALFTETAALPVTIRQAPEKYELI
jgi:NAD(P)-dependent dehydrogenase (short-subunit alcohol dehydrogenase family)